jgi:DNA-binding MarR family transcriptional regulator
VTDKPVPPGGWLDADQQRAWLAFMRVQLRLTFEMNRQLQAEADLSLPDYDVLNALSDSPGDTLSVTALAARLGWERSRLSHHIKRMAGRGLISSEPASTDRRVTQISLTTTGRHAIEVAAAGHVELVRHLFFDGLSPDLIRDLGTTLELVYANVLERGSLPKP